MALPEPNPQVTDLINEIVQKVHPLMAEGLYLAALPNWFDLPMYKTMRQREDNREAGLIERLQRYSFTERLETGIYRIRPSERVAFNLHWIQHDPEAYKRGHKQALHHIQQNPDISAYAQAQRYLYHLLFVDTTEAEQYLTEQVRKYYNLRHVSAIERLLDTAEDATAYLVLLGEDVRSLRYLFRHFRGRVLQLKGDWEESYQIYQALRGVTDLPSALQPYVFRAYGDVLTQKGQYVEALSEYKQSLALFETMQQGADSELVSRLEAERGYTMLAIGDAYVELGLTAKGYREPEPRETGWRVLRYLPELLLALPIVFYLARYLGTAVFHPRFWNVYSDLDWLVARLFAQGANYYNIADPILEAHGSATDDVAADERLARLSMVIGGTERAQALYERLIRQEEAPLTEYGQSSVRLGLGRTFLRLQQPDEVLTVTREALPILQEYQDRDLQADAHMLLGEALVEKGSNGDPALWNEATVHFEQALDLYQGLGDLVGATRVGEHLQRMQGRLALNNDQLHETQRIVRRLKERRYVVPYRHPVTVWFKRLTILFILLLFIYIPIRIISVENTTIIRPQISFQPEPLLSPTQPDFKPTLSQGVSALNVDPPQNPQIFVSLGMQLLFGYFVLSTAVGLLSIVLTPLQVVQKKGHTQAVRLDEDGIRIGRRFFAWAEIRQLVSMNIKIWRKNLPDSSLLLLVGPDNKRLAIAGSVDWYESLVKRVDSEVPETAVRLDNSFSLLNSKSGLLLTVVALILTMMSVVGTYNTNFIHIDIPGTVYGLGDLFPYIFLGIVFPVFNWFVVKPLRMAELAQVRFWGITVTAGLGLLLTVLRFATQLRPLLTVPDIYIPLLSILLTSTGLLAIFLAKEDDGKYTYHSALRWGGVLIILGNMWLMGRLLVRDVQAYHYLVVGNAYRDEIHQNGETGESGLIEFAIQAYGQSVDLASQEILGMNGIQATSGGIPPQHKWIWQAAINGRASIYAESNAYQKALDDYDALLPYTDLEARILASQAIAYQGLSAQASVNGNEQESRQLQHKARTLFEQAIERDRETCSDDFWFFSDETCEDASYYLWRAVSSHILSDTPEELGLAEQEYRTALAIEGPNQLTNSARANALVGLGWIEYIEGLQSTADQEALSLFVEATTVDPTSAQAHLAVGYVLYTLRQYDESITAWEKAYEQAPTNPAIPVSLGTLYWRIATVGDDYDGTGKNRCEGSFGEPVRLDATAQFERSLDYFDQALALRDEQTGTDLAFTYRTKAQVLYLYSSCPVGAEAEDQRWHKFETRLQATEAYSQAVQLEPFNPIYWHFRGRLAYSAWVVSPLSGAEARVGIMQGLADQEIALGLNPVEYALGEDYEPNKWFGDLYEQAVLGSLAQGDRRLSAGNFEGAMAYYQLVSQNRPATDAGRTQSLFREAQLLATTGDLEGARLMYETAVSAGIQYNHTNTLEAERLRFELFAFNNALLETELYKGIDGLFEFKDVPIGEPTSADEAFSLALFYAVHQNNAQESARLYELGLQLTEDRAIVAQTAVALANAVQTNDLDILAYYWPLTSTPPTEATDLYWRLRAEFGFRYVQALFPVYKHEGNAFASMYAQLVVDINQIQAIDEYQVWIDFFTDSNLGWHYVRRGDAYAERGAYVQARLDYISGSYLIQPDSEVGASDLAEARFKVGLLSLRLGDEKEAERWYALALRTVAWYEVQDARVAEAIEALEALLQEEPSLAPLGGAILEDIDNGR